MEFCDSAMLRTHEYIDVNHTETQVTKYSHNIGDTNSQDLVDREDGPV